MLIPETALEYQRRQLRCIERSISKLEKLGEGYCPPAYLGSLQIKKQQHIQLIKYYGQTP